MVRQSGGASCCASRGASCETEAAAGTWAPFGAPTLWPRSIDRLPMEGLAAAMAKMLAIYRFGTADHTESPKAHHRVWTG